MGPGRGRGRPLWRVIGLAAGLAASLTVLRRLDAVEVSGRSMTPTLLPGDRLLVESLSFARRPPQVGELVLAPDPRRPDRQLIKRVASRRDGKLELRGDGNERSTDSRVFGAIDVGLVRWRVLLRYWPLPRVGPVPGAPARRR